MGYCIFHYTSGNFKLTSFQILYYCVVVVLFCSIFGSVGAPVSPLHPSLCAAPSWRYHVTMPSPAERLAFSFSLFFFLQQKKWSSIQTWRPITSYLADCVHVCVQADWTVPPSPPWLLILSEMLNGWVVGWLSGLAPANVLLLITKMSVVRQRKSRDLSDLAHWSSPPPQLLFPSSFHSLFHLSLNKIVIIVNLWKYHTLFTHPVPYSRAIRGIGPPS